MRREQHDSTASLGLLVALMLAGAVIRPAGAQTPFARPELRPSVGIYVPTGSHNGLLERGPVLGGQVALELRPSLHAVFGFGWVATEQRQVGDAKRIEMAQFDLGAEWLRHEREGRPRRVSPFLGTGVGLRAYRSRDTDAPSQANMAGYGALGVEAAAGPVALRLEGRDYLSAFRGLDGADGTSMRNDVMVMFGIGLRLR